MYISHHLTATTKTGGASLDCRARALWQALRETLEILVLTMTKATRHHCSAFRAEEQAKSPPFLRMNNDGNADQDGWHRVKKGAVVNAQADRWLATSLGAVIVRRRRRAADGGESRR